MNSGSLAGATAASSTKAIGFLSPLVPSSKPKPGFAHAPDRLHFFRLERQRRGVADLLALAQFFEFVDLFFDLVFGFTGVLDHQQRIRVALDETQLLRLLDVAARQIKNHLVGGLHRVGRGFENRLGASSASMSSLK